MQIKPDVFNPSQDYEARGVVAQAVQIGHYQEGPLLRRPIYKYLTLDCGPGRPGIAIEFVREAEYVKTKEGSFLKADGLKEGEIVVSPGFVYKKIPWSTPLMNAHLKALKSYRRKDIIHSYVDKSDAPIDLGTVKPPTNTKQ